MTASGGTFVPRLSRNTRPRHTGVSVVGGTGAVFRDSSEKEYIDLSSQTVNLLYGQAHPEITRQVIARLQEYTFFDQDFDCPADRRAISCLHALLPRELVAFNIKMNNGSDAVESAVKQARRATGRSRVLTIDGIYLGQSTQVIHLRGLGKRPTDILRGSSEDVVFAPLPYCVEEDHDPRSCPRENGQAICDLIDQNLAELSCVVIDPIMISCGVFGGRAMPDLLHRVRAHTESCGVPLILDECQTFGWVPDHTLARHWNVTPDAMVLAKGVAAGFPLSVCAARDFLDTLEWGEADYTNGGHPAAMAAMEATCGLLTEQSQARHFDELVAALDELLDVGWEGQTRVRGVGLIRGVEVLDPRANAARPGHTWPASAEHVRRIADVCLRRGVYVRCYGSVLGIKPPRAISVAELTRAVGVVRDVIEELAADSAGARPTEQEMP